MTIYILHRYGCIIMPIRTASMNATNEQGCVYFPSTVLCRCIDLWPAPVLLNLPLPAAICAVWPMLLSLLPAKVLGRIFPPIVTGTTIFLIGLKLIATGFKVSAEDQRRAACVCMASHYCQCRPHRTLSHHQESHPQQLVCLLNFCQSLLMWLVQAGKAATHGSCRSCTPSPCTSSVSYVFMFICTPPQQRCCCCCCYTQPPRCPRPLQPPVSLCRLLCSTGEAAHFAGTTSRLRQCRCQTAS